MTDAKRLHYVVIVALCLAVALVLSWAFWAWGKAGAREGIDKGFSREVTVSSINEEATEMCVPLRDVHGGTSGDVECYRLYQHADRALKPGDRVTAWLFTQDGQPAALVP